jgi:hypothetical protein
MIQIIAALLVATWFFLSARAIGKRGIAWAFGGVVALVAPSIPWAIFAGVVILPAILGSDVSQAGAIVAAVAIGLSGIVPGLVIVFGCTEDTCERAPNCYGMNPWLPTDHLLAICQGVVQPRGH